jgi:thioredoxin reductase
MSKKVIIVGDGPGGLSAALFLAKNGMDVAVYGQDKTAMHWAYLYNYLGIPEIGGSAFQDIAREQVKNFNAQLHDERVESVTPAGDGFSVTTEGGETVSADFVILSEGKGARIANAMGLEKNERGIIADRDGRTSLKNAYAVGRGTNIVRSQAIISAGEGAAAALDILSIVNGKEFNDFDTPPDA